MHHSPGPREGHPPAPYRRGRFAAPLLAAALVAATPPAAAAGGPAPGPDGGRARQTSPAAPCPAGPDDPADPAWSLTSAKIDPEDDHHAFVGNGYLGQRIPPQGTGYASSEKKTGWPLFTPRYDGAFVAGLYAHNERTTENRHVAAALPTWSTLTVGTGEDTYDSSTPAARVSGYRQTLMLRCGLVRTSLTWTDAKGRATDLVYDVLADRRNEHVGAVRLRMTPHWTGDAKVTDRIDGRGARRITLTGGGPRTRTGAGRTMDVTFRTDGTKTDGAVASTLRPGPGVPTRDERPAAPARDLSARQSVTLPVRDGRSYDITKYVGIDTELTSRRPADSAAAASRRAAHQGWEALLAGHTAAWEKLWRSDVEVPGRPELQAWLRSAQYGLLSSSRRGSRDSIAPAGLTSDNYAGLIFWDAETWMYPGLLATRPELAKSIVEYRYRTRAGARANARDLGHSGLFYPWTSAGRGDLTTECHSVDPPHCRTQNHLQSDISLAAWQYYLATKDVTWLRDRGWPVLKGIAEFWADRATRNADGSYSIKNVAGPDEYSNGVDDGVFTNAGAAIALRHATRAAEALGEPAPARWNAVAGKLRIPFDEKEQVFQQYAGYKGSTIKQADTVLLMYPLEWPMTERAAANTLDHYAARTDPDGPAMTDSVHAIDAAGIGEPGCSTYTYLKRSVEPFVRGPFDQFSEARGDKAGASDPLAGSPAQDFLTGKGGFLQVFTHGLTGMRMREDRVELDPMLPPQLKDGVTLRGLRWQGRTYDVEIGAHSTAVRLTSGAPFEIGTPQGRQMVSEGAPAEIKTRRPDLTPTGNAARCRTAEAASEQPGMYAAAAVDGSPATAWVPDGRKGSLRVDLGRVLSVGAVSPSWTENRPSDSRVEVSTDGRHWREVKPSGASGELARPVDARYVRVTVRGEADSKKHPGVRELKVTKAPGS